MLVTDPQTVLISNQHTTGGASNEGSAFAPGLEIGANGTGSLTIANGASFQSDYSTYVGLGNGSNGTLTVTGDGSTLKPGRGFYVGYAGLSTGNVVVEGGAEVAGFFDLIIVGNNTTVTVTGTAASGNASTINTGGAGLVLDGQNDSLTIANGGQIPATDRVLLTGNSCTITVTDNGSSLAAGNSPSDNIGLEIDNGSSLTIANGASVTSNAAVNATVIGLSSNTTSSATVTGAGSVWNVNNGLVVGGNGNGSLTVANGGTVNGTIVLAQNSTSSGTLNLNNGSMIQVGVNSGLINGAGNATINWGGGIVQATGNFGIRANVVLMAGTNGGIVDTNGFNCTWGGNVSGSGNLTENGNGMLTIFGAYSATGDIIVNGGTLVVGNIIFGNGTFQGTNHALNSSGNIMDNGALTLGGAAMTTSGALSGNGVLTLENAALTLNGDISNFTGVINAPSNGPNLIFNQNLDTTFSGTLSGQMFLQMTGSGNLTLSGNNTFGGLMKVLDGTLILTGDTSRFLSADVETALVFNQSANSNVLHSIGGNGTVTQNGTATLMLSGYDYYIGATNVNSGTLLVTGNLVSSNVTVGAGATLGGNGTLGGAVVVNAGGSIVPGSDGTGPLAVGSLALFSGDNATFTVNGAGNYSQILSSGAVVYGGNVAINLGAALANGVYNLFAASGFSGDFDGITLSGTYAGSLTDDGGGWSGTFSGVNFTFDDATGVLTVAENFPPGTSATKQAWLGDNFSIAQIADATVSGDYANPSGDGIPNLIKYAFDLSPWEDGHAALPQPVVSDGRLVLTFPTPPADLIFSVEASTDLITWSASGVNVQNSGGQVTATYPLPDSGVAFLQVVVGPAP